ncbi:hypothetical protein MKX01_038911, partial [Papaver californicum]
VGEGSASRVFTLCLQQISVTEQEKALDGLHWFANMSEHLDQQLLSLMEITQMH